MSQFIEMFKDKQPNGIIKDLVDTNIKSVKKMYAVDDAIEYIDISSIESASRSISETTNCVVKSAPSRAQQCVEYGDILVSTVRPINRNIAVVTKKSSNLVASTGFCVLRPKESYREYLLSVVLTDKYTQKMCDKASGGLYPAVNNSDVLSYEIFIPDKEMLNRISALYNQADKSGFVGSKSQFIEMFGDPMTNDKQWPEFSCLNEVTQIVLGTTPKSNNPSYWDGDILWITPAEMTDSSYFIFDTKRHITEEGREAANLTMLPEGAVLFSTRAPIGKVGIVGKEMCSNQGFKNFICSKKINNIFLYYTLKFKKEYLCSLGTGTTFKELSKRTVESLQIAVPPIELQKQFESIYNQADKSGKCYEYRLAS